jgi:hypothetical protein
LVATTLTCGVLLTAYQYQTTSAQAVASQAPNATSSDPAAVAQEQTLAPGHFRFTTGLDKEPQYIQGSVVCDTKDGIHRIAIGDPDAGGVERGLSGDESILKYADLGYRNGVNLALVNDGETGSETGKALPAVHKTGNTYFASGYATGLTTGQRDTTRYFEISVACP